MAYFPIFTDISEKKCIIVGGGKVALRKVEALLRYDANVIVIAEQICDAIRALLPASSLFCRVAGREDIKNAALVVAATSSREANHQLYCWCREENIPVNVIDAPEECTFLFPAVVKRGDISIGINTGGKSPIISSRIRKDIESVVPDYYEAIADQLYALRLQLKRNVDQESERRRILKSVAAKAFELERPLTDEEISNI